MAHTEFHDFNKLPPEIRHHIVEALDHPPCLHAFYFNATAGRRLSASRFVDHYYCHAEMRYISPESRLKPELNLRRVNQEARDVVQRHHKDFLNLSSGKSAAFHPGVLAVDTEKVMFYLMNLKHSIGAMTRPLRRNMEIGQGLRHLALPLFDIAYWPDSDTRRTFDPSLRAPRTARGSC
ncbi:hypothetical protein PG994_002640 [Apiospora phragmitis]|uniref:2EXR domain-containing protein n=1 Tax=Apiospora phragmitis TaxID=2905665 RepID=A0ABR1W5V0_9PEZI